MYKVKIYLIFLNVLLSLGLIALVLVISLFSPQEARNVLLFYIAAGFSMFAASTLSGFYLRKLFGQREFLNSYVAAASRQGLWFALILVVSLILAHENLFTWINAGMLVLTLIFFESYLLTKDKNYGQ